MPWLDFCNSLQLLGVGWVFAGVNILYTAFPCICLLPSLANDEEIEEDTMLVAYER